MPENMKQMPLRLPKDLYEQLDVVAESSKSTKSAVVRAALRVYLRTESARLVEEALPRIEKLRAYAASGDGREKLLGDAMTAELEYGADDPAEGTKV